MCFFTQNRFCFIISALNLEDINILLEFVEKTRSKPLTQKKRIDTVSLIRRLA